MSLNVIKYEWDVSEQRDGAAIKNLNFHVWLGKNVRHVTIDLFEIYEKEETKVISEELDLKQLVSLRNFLNSLPFLDEELGEKND